MTDTKFENFPDGTYHSGCEKARIILSNVHVTSSSFLGAFEATRKARRAKGTTTDNEQDLLRAMLTFASSGLDSMIKQLVTDALPKVIDRHEGAQEQFREFVKRRLRQGQEVNYGFVAGVMADPDPRRHLVKRLVEELTSKSLQSVNEIHRVGAFFDIPSKAIIPDSREAQKIFAARNEIVHEMDVDFDRPNRNRRSRTLESMKSMTGALFEIALRFLQEVDHRLSTDMDKAR